MRRGSSFVSAVAQWAAIAACAARCLAPVALVACADVEAPELGRSEQALATEGMDGGLGDAGSDAAVPLVAAPTVALGGDESAARARSGVVTKATTQPVTPPACIMAVASNEVNCDGVDDDCDGKIDEGWTTTRPDAAKCIGDCRTRAKCQSGAVVCGAPLAEVPNDAGGKDEDCTGAINDEASQVSCTDNVDNDADGVQNCADATCDSVAACTLAAGAACAKDADCALGLVCVNSQCRVGSCDDGVRSPNETGVDCGGPCAACNGLSCEQACRFGEPTTPRALATLRFAHGVFTRSTTATYDAGLGVLQTARVNELRWIDTGDGRMALFEGATTNQFKHSSALEQTSAWTAPNANPMTVTANAETAPDGTLTAERLSFPTGPARSPRQQGQFSQVAKTVSFYARGLGDFDEANARAMVTSGAPETLLAVTTSPVDLDWQRIDLAATAPSAASVTGSFGLAHVAGWPDAAQPALLTSPLAIWGAQLEARPFPTSYVPSGATQGQRAADSLIVEAGNVPAWLRNEIWQVDVQPLFSSTELVPAAANDGLVYRHTLLSFGTTEVYFTNFQGGSAYLLASSGDSVIFASPALSWQRGDKLRLTFDFTANRKRVTLSGAEKGDGSYDAPQLALPAGRLRIGGRLSGGGEIFAALSELRKVSGPTEACSADAACTCGDSQQQTGELCDTGLTANCAETCQDQQVTTCDDDTDCASGSVCGQGNGEAFGFPVHTNLCWPAFCAQSAQLHCGPGAACGDCICASDCSGAVCGATNDDGCGQLCTGVCSAGESGGTSDLDCASGLTLGEDAGPSFGHAPGTHVCWPVLCEDPIQRRANCGENGLRLCGLCPEEPNDCGSQQCGKDQYGHVCGTCSGAEVCDEGRGACIAILPRTQPMPGRPEIADALSDPPADPAGSIPGEFSVTDEGAASYAIPLEVPPGRAGMTPSLALSYSSARGDGYVGHGWSLSGLSAITRCPRTFVQHGYAAGVDLSPDDAFCIDGQLLVKVPGGEYRTEIDSFMRVKAFGSEFNAASGTYTGPSYFQVWMKDGRVLTYGQDVKARVHARFDGEPYYSKSSPVNVSWMLQSVRDLSGNEIKFYYAPETHDRNGFKYTSELRPRLITYGASESHSITIGYGTDKNNSGVRSYRAGVGRHFSSPIESIAMSVDGKEVSRYELVSSMDGDQWMLEEIKHCANTSAGRRCLPATVLDYTDSNQSITKIATTIDEAGHVPINPNYTNTPGTVFEPDNFDNWQVASIDHDGDGRQDLLHSRFEGRGAYLKTAVSGAPDRMKLYLRRSHGLHEYMEDHFTAFHTLGPTTDKQCLVVTPVDFNDDGREDYIGRCATSPWQDEFETRLVLSTANGFSTRAVSDMVGAAPDDMYRAREFHALDLDGDGKLDFVACADRDGNDAELLFYRNTGNGFALAGRTALDGLSGDNVNCKSSMFVMDYDGDGRGNVLAFDSVADGNRDNDKTSRAFVLALTARGLTMKPLGVQPFAPARYEQWWGNETQSGTVYAKDYNIQMLDANGDGLLDVIHRYREERPKLYLSTGRGFVCAGIAPGEDTDYELYKHAFVFDHDSDGKDELFVPVDGLGWRVHSPYAQSGTGTAWRVAASSLPKYQARIRWDGKTRIRHSLQRPFAFDWDGDGVMELVTRNAPEPRPDDFTHPVLELYKAGPRTQRLLSSVTDGLGKRTDIQYSGAPANYVAGQCRYPQRCLKTLPMPVVVSHTESGSAGTFADARKQSKPNILRNFEYQYADARVDLRGRGLLGFGRRWVREFASPGTLIRETAYEYDNATISKDQTFYPFAGKVKAVTALIPSSGNMLNGPDSRTNLTTITNAWLEKTSADGRPFVVLDNRRTNFVEAVGAQPSSVGFKVEAFGYDAYGNATLSNTTWNDGRTLSTTTDYVGPSDADWRRFQDKWLVGLIRKQTVKSSRGGETKSYRLKLFYDGDGGARGLQDRIERWSMNGEAERSLEQTSKLGYDQFGNETSRRLTGRDATDQETSVKFDGRGMFPIEVHNGVHDAKRMPWTKIGVDVRFGEVQWMEEPDGSWNVSNRDAFGRTVETVDATGRRALTSYAMSNQNGASLSMTVRGKQQPTVETYYNAFGAVTETRTTEWAPQLAKAQTTVVEVGYDDQGRKVAQGIPHVLGTPSPAASVLYYDGLDRLIKEEHPRRTPEGGIAYSATNHYWGSKAYAGTAGDPVPWSVLSSAAWAHKTEDEGSGAWRVEVTDVEGQPVGAVDALQNLTKLSYGAFDRLSEVSAAGVVTTYLGDELGRTTHETDPNIGETDYVYDGLGLLRTKTRNGVLRATLYYDGLGRTVSADTTDGHYEWNYDGHGDKTSLVGQLESESLSSATIGNTSIAYEYDSPGANLSAIRRKIDGETFDTIIEPAELGRPGLIRYPVPGDRAFAVRFQYEPNHGRLQAVQEADTGTALWKLEEIDGFGNASRVSYSNGHKVRRAYEPTTGRLSSTEILDPSGTTVTEQRLTYDGRGFVDTRTTVEAGQQPVIESFTYDKLGRLDVHRDGGRVDRYRYNANGNVVGTPAQAAINYDEAGPHQVTSTSDARSFKYTDGNQTLRSGGGVVGGRQKIVYSAFDLPTQVLVGPEGSSTDQVDYHYDATNRRVSQRWRDGSKVVYAGDLYERATSAASEEEHLVRIPTPDGFAIEAKLNAGTEREFRFLHTDHLGSVLGMNDESRARVDSRSYTPFGRMTRTGTVTTRAGFTGHEMDTRLGLVNMRGRMYDPDIGRFLSSDPVVQDTLNSQNWNRYSYVLNNPLNATDPTGFESEGLGGEGGGGGDIPVVVTICYTPTGACPDEGPAAAEAPVNVYEGEGGAPSSTAAGGAGVGGGGGSNSPSPEAAHVEPEQVPVGASEVAGLGTAVGAFATGAVKGAAVTAAISYGLGYVAGAAGAAATAAGMAGAAAVAPAVLAVGGVAMAAWGIYELANGGAQQIVDTATRIGDGRATEADWGIAGGFFGSVLSGFKAPSLVKGGMQHGMRDVTTASRLGIGKAAARGGLCFAAGTLVHTAEGEKPIETVKPGDLVWSQDEHTAELALRRVVRTFVTPEQPVLEVVLEDENGEAEGIRATVEHPFWTQRGWVAARELQASDRMLQRSGAWAKVVSVSNLSKSITVYNFEVEQFHTYFVGERGVLVHNECALLTAGKNFKEHFITKRPLLERALGIKVGKFSEGGGGTFLKAITDGINNGTFKYVGQGTLKVGQEAMNIYRGQGLTIVNRTNGEWLTLLTSGEGMDLAIRMIP